MLKEQQDEMLAVDREDLRTVLTMRFGPLPENVKREIEAIDSTDTLERLILVAANVPTWDTFLRELREGKQAFKIVGNLYDPLAVDQQRE